MVEPTVPTWDLGDNVTAAKLQQMCDAIAYLLRPGYGVYTQTGTAQTIASATPTAINWNVNVRQSKVTHSTSSNPSRVTPTEPGHWLHVAKVELQSSATGQRKMWFRQTASGTEGSVQHSAVAAALHTVGDGAILYYDGVDDYVEVMYEQNSGGPLDLGYSEFNPRLAIYHLGFLA